MTLGPLLTMADLDAAIAGDEERLAEYRLTLTDCEEAGLDTAQASSLVHLVEGHLSASARAPGTAAVLLRCGRSQTGIIPLT